MRCGGGRFEGRERIGRIRRRRRSFFGNEEWKGGRPWEKIEVAGVERVFYERKRVARR